MAIGKDLFLLYDIIGYKFQKVEYLENALTHSSFANERKNKGISYPSNERLEFLGDAVLEIVISEYLYKHFKNYSEGALTKIRQYLVCEKTLATISAQLALGDYIHLGRGEELTDCRKRPKVLADALEALVAAIYLDSDSFSCDGAKEAVLGLFKAEIEKAEKMQVGDYKTMLQQLVEKDGASLLEYKIISESGPAHKKLFTVEAIVNNNVVGQGSACTKKDAEMQAARAALKLFGINV